MASIIRRRNNCSWFIDYLDFYLFEIILINNSDTFLVFREHCFKDKYLFYRFSLNDNFSVTTKNFSDRKMLEEQLQETILLLGLSNLTSLNFKLIIYH